MTDLCRKLCKLGKRIRRALRVFRRILNRDSREGNGGEYAGSEGGEGAPGSPEGSVMEMLGILDPDDFLLGIVTRGLFGFAVGSR